MSAEAAEGPMTDVPSEELRVVDRESAVRSDRTAADNYEIRHLVRDDERRILALLRQTVGETSASKKTVDFWQWKHSQSPFGSSYSVCAWNERPANIVGLRTLMWWSLRAPDGTILRAARAVDTATHPHHQRRGIFSRLTRFAIDDLRQRGAAFIFNTPNDQSLPGYLKMGWNTVARWPIYLRPVSWLATGAKLARGIGPGEVGRSTGPIRDVGLESWSEFRARCPWDLAELVAAHERRRPSVGYRTTRTPAFLDWRYGGHPEIQYRVHAVERDNVRGVVIARAVAGIAGLEALVVTDVFLSDPTSRNAAVLFRSLLSTTTCDYVMAHFAKGTIERRGLLRSGFVRAPRRGYTFAVRPLRSLALDPTRADGWDLTLSELEIF